MNSKSFLVIILLIASSFLVFSPALPIAHAATPGLVSANVNECDVGNTCTVTGLSGSTGNLVTVGVIVSQDTASGCPTSVSVFDSANSSYAATVVPLQTNCGNYPNIYGNPSGDGLYAAVASGSVITVTATLNGISGGFETIWLIVQIYNGTYSSATPSYTGTFGKNYGNSLSLTPSLPVATGQVAVAAIATEGIGPGGNDTFSGYSDCTNANGFPSGGTLSPVMCGTVSQIPSVDWSFTQNFHHGGLISGAVFGAALPSTTFSAVITNLDCGNCVIANDGKFYDFQVNVTSYAVNPFDLAAYNRTVSFLYLQFNDTVHTISVSYNYTTNQFNLESTDDGTITLGNGAATQTYNAALGYYDLVANFLIAFNGPPVVQAQNRGIKLEACTSIVGPSPGSCTGLDYVQQNYFNIEITGGVSSTSGKGLCEQLPIDVFSHECEYQSSPVSNIQTNDTWIGLQSYSTQFAITFPALALATQKFWQQRIGFYFWDNSTWVLGPNVVLSVLKGSSTAGEGGYSIVETEYYYGKTLISNQSISLDIEPTTPAQTRFYIDIWYSNINASTTWGMRVNAYYVGMHETGLWIWSSWSPLYTNQSTSEAFGSLYNHAGQLYSSTQIECTKVFWNSSMPGESVGAAVSSTQFAVEQFNLASSLSNLGGVDTPIYTQPLVPIISTTSNFFAPLYSAITSLGQIIFNALRSGALIIFNGLSAQFPWLTGTLTAFYQLILGYSALFLVLVNLVIGVLQKMYSVIGYIFLPIDAIISGYNLVVATYVKDFGGVNLEQVVVLFVLMFFITTVMGIAESREPTKGFMILAHTAWRIVDTIFVWVWYISKLILDFITGLIP